MKFLPTFELWNDGVAAALRNGQLKLQPGQWVSCGGALARLVRVTGLTIWVEHYGHGRHPHSRFMKAIDSAKGRKLPLIVAVAA